MSEFFLKLSEIAPVDIIAGNHDMNMKQESQGDVISPIFELSEILGGKSTYQVTKENVDSINLWRTVFIIILCLGFSISMKTTRMGFSLVETKRYLS